MSDIIRLLPDHVANQIAAGEVVQRPSSVVKELLENAIDAGATQIQLIIKEAGKTLIQVVDNGKGMSATDARLSFERHATSKIKKIDDLFALETKGFRGEALASIAAVSQVEMHTRQENDDVATFIKISGSKIENQDLSTTPKGTSILVKNIFFNIPARRNFLKSNSIELRHILDEFHRIAIAYPAISFSFYNNDSRTSNLYSDKLLHRICNIFGNKMKERVVPIEEKTIMGNISGYIVKPNFAKKNRGQQYFFVNNRFIKSPFLHHAVIQAFEGLIATKHHPGYFLFFELNPKTIDINIHPTKTEIKFEDEQSLYSVLKSAVKQSLGIFQVVSPLDFKHNPSYELPYAFKNKAIKNTKNRSGFKF